MPGSSLVSQITGTPASAADERADTAAAAINRPVLESVRPTSPLLPIRRRILIAADKRRQALLFAGRPNPLEVQAVGGGRPARRAAVAGRQDCRDVLGN